MEENPLNALLCRLHESLEEEHASAFTLLYNAIVEYYQQRSRSSAIRISKDAASEIEGLLLPKAQKRSSCHRRIGGALCAAMKVVVGAHRCEVGKQFYLETLRSTMLQPPLPAASDWTARRINATTAFGLSTVHFVLVAECWKFACPAESFRVIDTGCNLASYAARICRDLGGILQRQLDRAFAMADKQQPFLAAMDFIALLDTICAEMSRRISRVGQDRETLEALRSTRVSLCMNAAISLRECGCYAAAEEVIYRAFDLDFETDEQVLALVLPSHIRILLETCRIVQCSSTIEELMRTVAWLQSGVTNAEMAPFVLNLVRSCVQHYLILSALRRASLDNIETREAVRLVCTEFASCITSNQVKTIEECLVGGIPQCLESSGKYVRHAFAAMVDFSACCASLPFWSLAIGADGAPESASAGHVIFEFRPPRSKLADLSSELLPLFSSVGSQIATIVQTHIPAAFAVREAHSAAAMQSPESCIMSSFASGIASESFSLAHESDPFLTFVPALLSENHSFHPQPLLSDQQRQALHHELPLQLHGVNWVYGFSTRQHGYSMQTLFGMVSHFTKFIIVVRDETSIFGAFVAGSLNVGQRYGGAGETFVFSFPNAEGDLLNHYRWSGCNEFFCLCSKEQIAIGGGKRGPALVVYESLERASTVACETFASPPLSAQKADCTPADEFKEVEAFCVEVYGFEFDMKKSPSGSPHYR